MVSKSFFLFALAFLGFVVLNTSTALKLSPRKTRRCRMRNDKIKECQCGPNKIVYEVGKDLCHNGELYKIYGKLLSLLFSILSILSSGTQNKTKIKEGSVGDSKRGIAWPNENKQDDSQIFAGGKAKWIYNWTPNKVNVEGLEFVPMLWNGDKADQFRNNIPEGTKAILGFNEPERGEQANMSPVDAASVWKEHIEPLAQEKGIRLGSPSVASTQEGLRWLQDFLGELEKVGGHIDFLALHWYGQGVDGFIGYLTDAHERLGGSKYPVWVTEFACTSWKKEQPASQEEINDFLVQSTARLDALDWVERYSWFGAERYMKDETLGSGICLIGEDGQLSELGRKYLHD
jgi:hypothetical protein